MLPARENGTSAAYRLAGMSIDFSLFGSAVRGVVIHVRALARNACSCVQAHGATCVLHTWPQALTQYGASADTEELGHRPRNLPLAKEGGWCVYTHSARLPFSCLRRRPDPFLFPRKRGTQRGLVSARSSFRESVVLPGGV